MRSDMAIRSSKKKEIVKQINHKLKENKDKYGKAYSPCVLSSAYTSENSDDYVCMCKEFREQKSGECHCGKFIKE